MSENGEIYTSGKNVTLPPAVTEIANRFHHLICQIPHCNMDYTLYCEFDLFFLSHARTDIHTTPYCHYKEITFITFHCNYHCVLDCKNYHRLYSMHPGEIAPSPLASLVSVVNKILISKVSSTPPPLVMDEIRNRSLVKL